MIPYARQSVSQTDIDTVIEALGSAFLTQGPTVPRFENKIAEIANSAYAIAVSSGTAALHIAALAAGLGPKKKLWTSPNTFVASANCALYCGADVDFVDIKFDDGNMSVEKLSEKLKKADKEGTLPDVVVPVHFAGHACDMPAIKALANHYGFIIIEDASHAIGGWLGDHAIGACNCSDMTVFSFHPVKIITTAEGGAVTTNDPLLAERLRMFSNHGITRNRDTMESDDGPWFYEQKELGFNYRLSDLHAALGLSQAARINDLIDERHRLAERYDRAFQSGPVTPIVRDANGRSALHLYPVRVPRPSKMDRKSIFEELKKAGINAQVHYIPVHLQPFYRKKGFKPNDFPEAERHYATSISLPLFPGLKGEEQDYIISTLKEMLA